MFGFGGSANRRDAANPTTNKNGKSVVVVGAGIVGVMTSYYLQKCGYSVTVVEENSHPAEGTSFANAGRMCPTRMASYPFASPSVLSKLIWLPFEKLSDMVIKKKDLGDEAKALKATGDVPSSVAIDTDLLTWGVHFLRNCTSARFNQNNKLFQRISHLSVKATEDLFHLIDKEKVGFKPSNLWMYGTKESARAAVGLCQSASQAGFDNWELLEGKTKCSEACPPLASFLDRLDDAGYSPSCIVSRDDYSVDARKFTNEVITLMPEVEFKFETRVQDVVVESKTVKGVVIKSKDGVVSDVHADHVVFCTGPSSKVFMRDRCKTFLPIQGMRGCTVDLFGVSNGPDVSVADYLCGSLNYQATPFSGGHLRVIGYADFVPVESESTTWPLDPRHKEVGDGDYGGGLIERTKLVFPGMTWKEQSRPWFGIRPVTPDALPIIGEVSPYRYSNLWVNVGHGSIGWSLSTGSALVLCREILEKDELKNAYVQNMTRRYGLRDDFHIDRFSISAVLSPTFPKAVGSSF